MNFKERNFGEGISPHAWACVMVMLGKLHANIHGTSLLKKIEKSPYQNQESDVGIYE
jgi:hypothetical protein